MNKILKQTVLQKCINQNSRLKFNPGLAVILLSTTVTTSVTQCGYNCLKVIESSWTPDTSVTLYPGFMMDINEVKCLLPESPVNIGDYGNEGVTAAGLKLAVSNNRVNISKVAKSFITYDSVCQECNTTTGCRLKVTFITMKQEEKLGRSANHESLIL